MQWLKSMKRSTIIAIVVAVAFFLFIWFMRRATAEPMVHPGAQPSAETAR
jgi:hypothetical protein